MSSKPLERKTPNARSRERIHPPAEVKDLPRLEVLWEDAALDTTYDGHLLDLPPTGLVLNRTIGFLAKETSKEITLVRDATDSDNTVRWPYSIPKRLIRKRITLVPA